MGVGRREPRRRRETGLTRTARLLHPRGPTYPWRHAGLHAPDDKAHPDRALHDPDERPGA